MSSVTAQLYYRELVAVISSTTMILIKCVKGYYISISYMHYVIWRLYIACLRKDYLPNMGDLEDVLKGIAMNYVNHMLLITMYHILLSNNMCNYSFIRKFITILERNPDEEYIIAGKLKKKHLRKLVLTCLDYIIALIWSPLSLSWSLCILITVGNILFIIFFIPYTLKKERRAELTWKRLKAFER